MEYHSEHLGYGDELESVGGIEGDFGLDPGNEDEQNADSFIPDGGLGCFASVLVDGGNSSVTSCTFDHLEELLWMGNSVGHVTSYYGPCLQKYTSFKAHPSAAVRQVLSAEMGILSLSSNQVKCHARTGLSVFNYGNYNFTDMQSMCLLSDTQLVLGGYHKHLIQLDMETLTEVRCFDIREADCAMLRINDKYLFSGDTSGKVALRDIRSLDSIHCIDAHSGTISDFDVRGNKLVCCGFSKRQGHLSSDRFLTVFDLRTLRSLPPTPVGCDPMFLRFLPGYSENRLIVASQAGQFQIHEFGVLTPVFVHQIEAESIFCMEACTSKQCVAFGDGAGFLHLFADREQPVFNETPRQTEFGEPQIPPVSIPFTDLETPFSVIPMPNSESGQLLSDWPAHLGKRAYRKLLPVDADILKNMREVAKSNIGYAPNPGTRLRNQVPYDLAIIKRIAPVQQKGKSASPNTFSPPGDNGSIVPKIYRKVTVKHSKLFTEDFDYSAYNKTSFSGLESHVANSYCNPLLIMFYHIVPLRNCIQSHICGKEFCLACEMGFLFKMLTDLRGSQPCSPNNFVRAFRTLNEAGALGLVMNDKEDIPTSKVNLSQLIQSFNQFILRQLHSDMVDRKSHLIGKIKSADIAVDSPISTSDSSDLSADEFTPTVDSQLSKRDVSVDIYDKGVEDLFSSHVDSATRCLQCGHTNARQSVSMLTCLAYPTDLDLRTKPMTFESLIERSLSTEQSVPVWCEKCCRYQQSVKLRSMKSLPNILMFNCQVDTDHDKEFWAIQQKTVKPSMSPKFDERSLSSHPPWISQQVCVSLGDAEVHVAQTDVSDPNAKSYRLMSVLSVITDKSRSHLVASVRNPDSSDSGAEWLLFNDIQVVPVPMEDSLVFNTDWRVPCVLCYVATDLSERFSHFQMSNPISKAVFSVDAGEKARRLSTSTFVPLEPHEIPERGSLVAIDAEFVTLNQEEAELRSDGTRSMIKPSQMSLARVSCVRGSGPLMGLPFMDDYISTQEEVVDYLTKFSGIQPGDLNPSMTSKHLTTLKAAYLKLRYLVDQDVIFVGHGLANDFRVINIVVKPENMIDTVQLYHLPAHRYLSLRFLAWHFLDIHIQSSTHDSVEDARTALKLYQKYQELVALGLPSWNRLLQELYEKGRCLQWNIPVASEPRGQQSQS